jgi:hypothetical protein
MYDEEISGEMHGMLIDSKVPESSEDIARMIGPLGASLSAKATDVLVPSNVGKVSQMTNSKTHIQPPKLRFIKQIRAHQLLSKARRNRPKVVQDYVLEETLPKRDPKNSFLGFFPYPDIFRVSRPLKPKRIDAAKSLAQHGALIGSGDSGCKISIQVLRGFNIPVRSGLVTKFSKANGPIHDPDAPVKYTLFQIICNREYPAMSRLRSREKECAPMLLMDQIQTGIKHLRLMSYHQRMLIQRLCNVALHSRI